MTTRILAGGVPEPEELFGRDHTIHYIWEQLRGNNVLLVAPRRFGKTGVMNHLLKRPRSGYIAVYLEVEDIHDPEAFFSRTKSSRKDFSISSATGSAASRRTYSK